ncbi:MAG: translocase of outer mitochondrial membrane [Monoraphidium minutum]|nr:MAG: translocase of outer mitochondrial membrane [Monoraphidium minutum]
MFGDDNEREQYFEAAVAQAQRDYRADNTNVQALVRWGGAMLELAHYKQGEEAVQYINEAIIHLEEALKLDPTRTEAQWCIGNAHTSLGFLQQTKGEALEHFDRAKGVFQACKDKDPSNETYCKAYEMCEKAPEYYDEIQAQIQQAQAAAGAGGRGSGGKRGSGAGGARDPVGISDFWWDAAGWVALGAAITAVVLMARGGAGAAPSPA